MPGPNWPGGRPPGAPPPGWTPGGSARPPGWERGREPTWDLPPASRYFEAKAEREKAPQPSLFEQGAAGPYGIPWGAIWEGLSSWWSGVAEPWLGGIDTPIADPRRAAYEKYLAERAALQEELPGTPWAPAEAAWGSILIPETFGGYELAHQDKPVVDMPSDVEQGDLMGQVSFLNANAYGSIFIDADGRIMTLREAQTVMTMNPNAQVTKVWFMGGDEATRVTFSAIDLNAVEEMGLAPEQVAQAILSKQQMGVREQFDAAKADILAGDMSFSEKRTALRDLVVQHYGRKDIVVPGVSVPSEGSLDAEIFNSLSATQQWLTFGGGAIPPGTTMKPRPPGFLQPTARAVPTAEELAATGWALPGQVGGPSRPEPSPEEELDTSLQDALAKFGITVLDDYPFISPISEAHYKRLPPNLIKQMVVYLAENGLSWRDWIGISPSFYAGAAPQRPRWGVPSQMPVW